jgi:hypothetical protein
MVCASTEDEWFGCSICFVRKQKERLAMLPSLIQDLINKITLLKTQKCDSVSPQEQQKLQEKIRYLESLKCSLEHELIDLSKRVEN